MEQGRGGAARRRAGGVAVACVLALAGLLFAASAGASDGTDLRSEGPDLAGLVRDESGRVDHRTADVAALRAEVDALTAGVGDARVRALEDDAAGLAPSAQMAELRGPGLSVTLDDADFDRPVPDTAKPDDLVVHQQDLQGVVNALWAGGAEGVMVMDQRIVSTSAVTCVGSTLRLQGRVYSPPYTVRAVGDVDAMQAALDDSPSVSLYRDYARVFGLGWSVTQEPSMDLPPFDGSLDLQYASVPEEAAP